MWVKKPTTAPCNLEKPSYRHCDDCRRRWKRNRYAAERANGIDYVKEWRIKNAVRYKETRRKYSQSARGKNKKKLCSRISDLANFYGLTPEDVEYLRIVQDNKCSICRQEKFLVIDHDHAIGKNNRGLLCKSCNFALGLLKDRPALLRQAAEYLEAWASGRQGLKAV